MAEHIERMDRQVLSHLNSGEVISYRSSVLVSVVLSEVAETHPIFDATHEFVGAGESGYSSIGPALFCKLADLTSDPEEDYEQARVFVNGTEYQIRDSEPDGKGGVTLRLHKIV